MSDYCKRCGGPEPLLCTSCVIEKDGVERQEILTLRAWAESATKTIEVLENEVKWFREKYKNVAT